MVIDGHTHAFVLKIATNTPTSLVSLASTIVLLVICATVNLFSLLIENIRYIYLTCLQLACFFPFSERKGLTFEKCMYVCLSVCPSQSETSFFILRFSEVLIEIYYRLTRSRNSNMKWKFGYINISAPPPPSSRKFTNQKLIFLF